MRGYFRLLRLIRKNYLHKHIYVQSATTRKTLFYIFLKLVFCPPPRRAIVNNLYIQHCATCESATTLVLNISEEFWREKKVYTYIFLETHKMSRRVTLSPHNGGSYSSAATRVARDSPCYYVKLLPHMERARKRDEGLPIYFDVLYCYTIYFCVNS